MGKRRSEKMKSLGGGENFWQSEIIAKNYEKKRWPEKEWQIVGTNIKYLLVGQTLGHYSDPRLSYLREP
jgi:hypothetical protein